MTESKARRAERLGQPMGPRICAGTCGSSLEGRDSRALYCHSCVVARTRANDIKKARLRRSLTDKANRGTSYRESIKSVDHRGHEVSLYDGNIRVKKTHPENILCKECMGMSWRRAIRCPECLELYAPEPAREIEETLRSSAGALIGEGKLYGYTGHGGGHHGKK